MQTVEFIFDFASPNAYLSYHSLAGVEQRCGAKFVITPCLLGGIFKATGNQAPMSAYAGVPSKLAYQRLEFDRYIERHGLDRFRMNPSFPVNTLGIMRGAIVADQAGEFDRYAETMLAAMWEDGRKMDDPAEIAAVLKEGGYDVDRYLTGVQDQAIKDKLVANTASAVERGAFGIPTFFVGNQMWFGKERLADVERYLGEQNA